MAKKAGTKAAKAAPKPKKSARPKRAKASASRVRSTAEDKTSENKNNAADALIGLLESPLVADLLAAAISAAAATAIEHKLKKSRGQGSLVRAVGAAAATAVGRQLAEELRDIRQAAKDAKAAK